MACLPQNVVGYSTTGLQEGNTIVTPQFVGMTVDGAIDLQSIKCNDGCSDMVFLSTLDSVGAKVDTYVWINYGGDSGDEECWADDGYVKVEGVTFQPGQGLWVEGTDAEQAIQTSGQVGTSDVVVQLQNGNTMTGNFTPVAINLQDITCNDGCSDMVFLSTLDSVGAKIDTYVWINYGGDTGDEECWADDGYVKVEGVTIEPGQGLWVEATDESQTITFPGVEL